MIRTATAAVAATLLLAGAAIAQQAQPPAAPPPVDFSKVEIKTTSLGDEVYMLEGQGGNITVAVGEGRHHHGGWPVRAAARQDQGRDFGGLEPADQISHQHALSWRPHRRKRVLCQGRRHHRRPGQCQKPPRGGHDQRPHRQQDAAGAERCAALQDLHHRFQDNPAPRPRRQSQAHPELAYRRRHLCVVQDRQRAFDRRHLHQWPLSQYRFRQWRQHQGHDRGGRRLSQADQRQEPDRAGPWADRGQERR